ncbi:hypothetical protein FQR65_LT14095 [Abscondita terminalis]|nr:hypothetical protein FQR65_LT14095 [Abscondita terminalis]
MLEEKQRMWDLKNIKVVKKKIVIEEDTSDEDNEIEIKQDSSSEWEEVEEEKDGSSSVIEALEGRNYVASIRLDVMNEDEPFLKVKLNKKRLSHKKNQRIIGCSKRRTDRIRKLKIKEQNLVKKRTEIEQILSEGEMEDVVYKDSTDPEEFSAVDEE